MKATGLEGDASPEIIEIIDDDTDAFGARAPSHTVHDTGGPRWIGPVAAVALLALIGWGVATSASDNGPPKAAPVTSTTVETTTTRPAPPTTTPPPPVPYYTATPPRDYTIQGADIFPADDLRGASSNRYQLWAVPGSSAASGSWLAIETYSGTTPNVENAVRRVVGDTPVAISRLPAGQILAVPEPRGGSTVTITSFGVGEDQLAQLAATISLSKGKIAFEDPGLLDDLQLVTDQPVDLAVQGLPVEQLYYQSADGQDGIFIGIAERSTAVDGNQLLERGAALDFYLQRRAPFEVDGHPAVAGTTVGQYQRTLATWLDGGNIVTVSANLPIAQLISVARTVRRVDESEWKGLQLQVQLNQRNNTSEFTEGKNHPISYGTDGNGDPWTIEVTTGASYGGRQQLIWFSDDAGIGAAADDRAHVRTAVNSRRTYVVADLPRAIAATAELHVLRDGFDPVVVPFNDPDPTVDRTFAGYAFSEPVDYTAQIVGPDGAVLASWPTP